MEFNPSKCTVLHITRARTPVQSSYSLHGQILKSVSSAKYLGVNLTADLTWKEQVQKASTAGNRTLGFLKRNIRSKNPGIRSVAYKAMVRPTLEYASAVWSPYTKQDIDKVEMVQRRAARWVMHDYSRTSSVSSMLDHLKWRSLQDRRSDARLCLFFKIVHRLVAIEMPPYIQHPVRGSRLSHSLSFRQIHTHVDYYKYSLFPLAVFQWNSLPADIAMLPRLESFRRAIGTISHHLP